MSLMPHSTIDPSSIQGHLFLLVAPSGAGKSTLIEYILGKFPELHFPISATTRPPRPGEIEGQDYYYLTAAEFEQKINQGDFLEYAHVHGQTYYGTLINEVILPLQQGKNVIRHIDYQGVNSIRDILPNDKVHVIYIDAGSWSELLVRIEGRSELGPELERRHNSFKAEQDFMSNADIVISNRTGELEAAKIKLINFISGRIS